MKAGDLVARTQALIIIQTTTTNIHEEEGENEEVKSVEQAHWIMKSPSKGRETRTRENQRKKEGNVRKQHKTILTAIDLVTLMWIPHIQ